MSKGRNGENNGSKYKDEIFGGGGILTLLMIEYVFMITYVFY